MLQILFLFACFGGLYSATWPILSHAPVVIAHHPFPLFYHTSPYQVVLDASKDKEVKSGKIESLDETTEVLGTSESAPPAQPEEASEDGSYKPDNSGDYVPDSSGDYAPDNSGAYNPEANEPDESTPGPEEAAEVKLDKTAVHVFTGNPIVAGPIYSFGFRLVDQTRDESANAMGYVLGSYSFRNSYGTHDLRYKAGAGIGFLPIAGSLSKPNGLSIDVDKMKLISQVL